MVPVYLCEKMNHLSHGGVEVIAGIDCRGHGEGVGFQGSKKNDILEIKMPLVNPLLLPVASEPKRVFGIMCEVQLLNVLCLAAYTYLGKRSKTLVTECIDECRGCRAEQRRAVKHGDGGLLRVPSLPPPRLADR